MIVKKREANILGTNFTGRPFSVVAINVHALQRNLDGACANKL